MCRLIRPKTSRESSLVGQAQDIVYVRDGIANSKIVLVFLTRGALRRNWVQFEIREAMRLHKRIAIVHETSKYHHGIADLNAEKRGLPKDIQHLFDVYEFEEHERSLAKREIMWKKLFTQLGLPLL